MAWAILVLLVAVLAVLGLLVRHLGRVLAASEKRLYDTVINSEIRLQKLLSTEIGDIANVLVSIAEELPKLPVTVIERIETLVPAPSAVPQQLPLPFASPPPPIPPGAPANRVARLVLMDENRARVVHETTIDARRIPRGHVEYEGQKYICCDKDTTTNTYTYRQIHM